MLDFMTAHPQLKTGRLSQSFQKPARAGLWKVLEGQLNADGNGPAKNVKKWQKAWTDWKCLIRTKAARVRRHIQSHPNSVASDMLAPLEERLLSLIGRYADDDELNMSNDGIVSMTDETIDAVHRVVEQQGSLGTIGEFDGTNVLIVETLGQVDTVNDEGAADEPLTLQQEVLDTSTIVDMQEAPAVERPIKRRREIDHCYDTTTDSFESPEAKKMAIAERKAVAAERKAAAAERSAAAAEAVAATKAIASGRTAMAAERVAAAAEKVAAAVERQAALSQRMLNEMSRIANALDCAVDQFSDIKTAIK